ncbi:multidrug ABC transporter substrate-binding protein [Alteromonas sp. V450]|uniref:ABC transporter permease n=1 Tax=Alteromonas sp. V450 TaxID=1912139 RepID=UPI0008FF1C42|nr:ABC transporter permease [Alteromonas sp. V450]OJF68921.1 multidrug ABC transporter substrate-binding protein [Alteromonas sp. V450]
MLNPMKLLFETSSAAVKAIHSHGLRSGLTTIGIAVGVAAVIAIIAILEGTSASIKGELADLGSDMVTLKPFTNTNDTMLGVTNKLSYNDYTLLKGKVSGVKDMTVSTTPFSLNRSVSIGQFSTVTQIIGTESSYQNVINVYPQAGRFISPSDDKRRRRVAFIGASVARQLQIQDEPIGKFISLGGDWFKVIGVAEKRGSLFGFDQDNYVVTPFSTAKSLFGENATSNIEIKFNPEKGSDLAVIKQKMTRLLRQRYNLADGAPNNFEFTTAEKTKAQFDNIINSVTLVAGCVVGVSLLVGGIGIMNIMLVSVTERTREIGIQKALGATPNYILSQFITEAVLLSLLGGVVGVALGYACALFASLLVPSFGDVAVPFWAILLSFGFTTFIGIIFGIAPALKASALNPIDALRFE